MKKILVALLIACVSAGAAAHAQQPPGALAPANLKKPRPAAPFDLTGTWQHDGRFSTWHFVPEKFTLTPEAQKHYDAGVQALKNGGVYRDDVGQCWPAGMPMIMTRVWPIAVIQLPTVIYMIPAFENEIRIIYLDGRTHTPADEVVRTFNGESIGHWEGRELVVDTMYFPGHHHWMDQGGASIPVSEDAHFIERYRMVKDGTFEVDYTMTDPKSWVGEWKMTKRFNRKDDTDVTEVQCLPDLNSHLPATTSKALVK